MVYETEELIAIIFGLTALFQDQADGINIYSWLNKQESIEMASTPTAQTSPTSPAGTSTNIAYRPVYKHWFYKTTSESKRIWIPFSFSDSMLLESALAQGRHCLSINGLARAHAFILIAVLLAHRHTNCNDRWWPI